MPTTERNDPLQRLLEANIEPGPDERPPLTETLARIEAANRSGHARRVGVATTSVRDRRWRPRRTVVLAGLSVLVVVAGSTAIVSGPSESGRSSPLGVLQAAAASAKADAPSTRFSGYVAETVERSNVADPTATRSSTGEDGGGNVTRTWKIVRRVSDSEFEGQLVSLWPAPSAAAKRRTREMEQANAKRPQPVTDAVTTSRREGDQIRSTSTWRRPYGTLFSGALRPGERPAPVPSDPEQARRAVASWATGTPPADGDAGEAELLEDAYGKGDGTQLALGYALSVLTAPRVAPEVRAAVYEALAEVPNVRIDPHATDRLGRSAAAILTETVRGPTTTRTELLIDPDAARVLAERYVSTVRPGANEDRPPNEPPFSEGSAETTYRYQD